MKLIHLPTGETAEWSEGIAKEWLKDRPDIYIRAELPEYWRVEGYDKSWDYFGMSKNFKHLGVNEIGKWGSDTAKLSEAEISRAEFEHHIYNPWKAKQSKASGITSGDYRKLEFEDLRMEAEKMGFELVRKPIEWETDTHAFVINQRGVDITDKADDEGVFINDYHFETLIEKYNQFKNI